MERKAYVSPYLKIREDRKLTDEQKRQLLEQVSKNTRRTEETEMKKASSSDLFTIERGQLVYQGNESPKLPPREEKPVAPSSPLSPRPWFKRHSGSANKEAQKSLEKRSKQEEKDLPEVGYARSSFFGNAGRFNFFTRMHEDTKKKERDAEKRKSQIGIPNISELDREAAEIVNQSRKLSDAHDKEEERPRSAKDLISKFEADSSIVNRVTLNTSFIGRREFFGDMKQPEPTKLPQPRKTSDLMALWTCPYCTLQNPNWKIICEACEKIKPYEKRFMTNGEAVKSSDKDRKTEAMLKYFNPPTLNGLSKSPSETAVVKSLKKSPSPSRISGSPQLNLRRNLIKHQESIEVILEEPNKVKVKTPDLNEVRSARLAKFNLAANLKRSQLYEENANMSRKKSPEKRFPDKLDFSDPVALEVEKERLREKIRAMNAKALADRYPVLRKQTDRIEDRQQGVSWSPGPSAPPLTPTNTQEASSRLGAIRKTFKTPPDSEKILNQEETKKPPKKLEEVPETAKVRDEVEELYDQLQSKDGIESFKATLRSKSINKSNTLAINNILRNLEDAIADGKFDEAAQLATDLAKMKVSLSVTRQRDRPKSDIELTSKCVR